MAKTTFHVPNEQPNEMPISDYGTAPVIYVRGVARVDLLGDANFACWAWRTTNIDGRIERRREVIANLVMPCSAVSAAIELTLDTFGPRLLWPAARRLVS